MMATKQLQPGRYEVTLGKMTRRATVFEDIDAGALFVRFDVSDRVQRLDEIDPAAKFKPVKDASGASRSA